MLKFNFQQKASKTPNNQIHKSKKISKSQIKYQKSPDIITQINPLYLNNFIQPINPHQLAFTPTNHSKILQQKKMLLPQKSKEFFNKKTLILDLDETLVHSSFVPFENNDIVLNVEFESIIYNIYVLIRPGAIEFIKKVSKLYEVVIFTASISKYALPLLDIIDEDKNIKYKLTREHCTFLNGIYIKELKKLNRDLSDLIILDNSPLAYSFDNDNGLPIKAWYEDKNDNELDKVYSLLEFLSKVKDVRNFIKKFVNNNEINFDIANEIMKFYNNTINEFVSGKKIEINNDEEQNEKLNEKISVNIKQNDQPQTKSPFNNNKENDNINVNKEEKLIKNNIKPNKGILINNLIHTSTYRNKSNNKKDITYKNNINNYDLRNINYTDLYLNRNKNSALTNKNKSKEINLKSNISTQKKKNAFRIGLKQGGKFSIKSPNKINNIQLKNNNIFFFNNAKFNINNNNENDILLVTTMSKTSKDVITPKGIIKYKLGLETDKKLYLDKENIKMKNNFFSDKANSLNFNYINKKYKYTNLLEKLERKTTKTNFSLNNKIYERSKSSKLGNSKNNLKNKFQNKQNDSKKKLNHIGSYIINKYNGLIIGSLKSDNKTNSNSTVTRSKSTGSFINFNKNFKKPNTSKGNYNFEKNLLIAINKDNNNGKNKGINLLAGF